MWLWIRVAWQGHVSTVSNRFCWTVPFLTHHLPLWKQQSWLWHFCIKNMSPANVVVGSLGSWTNCLLLQFCLDTFCAFAYFNFIHCKQGWTCLLIEIPVSLEFSACSVFSEKIVNRNVFSSSQDGWYWIIPKIRISKMEFEHILQTPCQNWLDHFYFSDVANPEATGNFPLLIKNNSLLPLPLISVL